MRSYNSLLRLNAGRPFNARSPPEFVGCVKRVGLPTDRSRPEFVTYDHIDIRSLSSVPFGKQFSPLRDSFCRPG
jgi:hypothetical protein